MVAMMWTDVVDDGAEATAFEYGGAVLVVSICFSCKKNF
jgi:hypothetical protein